MMRPSRTLLVLLATLVLLGGCTKSATSPPPSPTAPSRIVSLLPSATELIVAVGQERRLVGVTLNDNYPPSVAALSKVGDQAIDFEKLIALKPDLVVLDSNFNRDRKRLDELGLRVFELRCNRLSEIAPAMRALAEALGDPEAGERAAKEFERQLTEIPSLSGLSEEVFVEVWAEPLMTAGNETLLNDILSALKLKNCYGDQTGYFQVDPEDVAKRRPGVVLVPTGDSSGETRSKVFELSQGIGWTPKVVEVESDLLVRAGPRVLEGAKALADSLKNKSAD